MNNVIGRPGENRDFLLEGQLKRSPRPMEIWYRIDVRYLIIMESDR